MTTKEREMVIRSHGLYLRHAPYISLTSHHPPLPGSPSMWSRHSKYRIYVLGKGSRRPNQRQWALRPHAALRRRWRNMAPHLPRFWCFGTLWVPSSRACRQRCCRRSSLLWSYVNERDRFRERHGREKGSGLGR